MMNNRERRRDRRKRSGCTGESDDDGEWEEEEEEYKIEELEEGSPKNSWKSYLRLIWSTARSGGSSSGDGGRGGNRSINNNYSGLFIEPDCRWYMLWTHFILLWAVYSSFFTPLEFAFFRGLPENLFLLDIAGQFAFLVDIIVRFFVVYRDHHSYSLVYNHNLIAIRYLRSRFIFDLLGCLPWDYIYKVSGKKESVRYLLWIRLSRAVRVTDFFEKLEKDIRVNYLFTRIIKLFVVELYCTHTAACIFYYLATTLPPSREGYTWIGSLKMGDYTYMHFRDIDLWTRYITSLYFAIVTMATVGYGEIHAVNPREMIFVMIYVSFDMILGAYLLGNMTALIVKGSKTEKFRDKMADLIKYMNRNKLGKDIRKEIKRHVQLQYESGYNEAAALQDIPIATRAKIAQTIYEPYIRKAPLFRGCSDEFLKQMAINVHEEFFLPGELIIDQGDMVDQLYFVCYGKLDEVRRHGDYGIEESLLNLEMYSTIGEVFVLCDMSVPYAVRANQLCRLLRISKQDFIDILDKCFLDGRIIINNLLEGNESSIRTRILESKVTLHVAKHESEFAMRLNCAAQYGDLHRLKCFVEAGADLNLTDYSGRSALHVAAAKGYDDIAQFLIEKGASVNVKDIFGNTPLLEALRNGNDAVSSLLTNAGASLLLDKPGNCLCDAVSSKEVEFVKRLLDNGVNANSKNYDQRTPLHVAASEGLYPASVILLEAGATVLSFDRWGKTPLDEAKVGGNRKLINLLEEAMRTESLELSRFFSRNLTGLRQKIKCTVFPQNPLIIGERKFGVVLWVPESIEELIEKAKEKLQVNGDSFILLSENGGKILDINMICDDQKLFLVNETP